MKKTLTILGIFIAVSYVVADSGNNVPCGTQVGTSGCALCGQINKFSYVSGNFCKMTDCTNYVQNPSIPIIGYMCKSCFGIPNAHSVYTGPYQDSGNCVTSCPQGKGPDQTFNCVLANGNNVGCGTNGSPGNCIGCGTTSSIQNLFHWTTQYNCLIQDCSANPGSNLNGYACKSCSGLSYSYASYTGQYFNPNTSACVPSCPNGTKADGTNTCISTLGTDISCGTPGSPGNCTGCGATTPIQNLFQWHSGSNCQVLDCTAAPGSNLNGNMCKSCHGQSQANSAYNAGSIYDGATSSCASSCSTANQAPDSTFTCVSTSGADVSCGAIGSPGNCNGCGATVGIQGLFKWRGMNNCYVSNCNAAPGSNLNGNMCKSCVGQATANAAYIGQYFDPNTTACVSSCPLGTKADETNTCISTLGIDVGCGTSGSPGKCTGCGATTAIQNLFQWHTGSNCKVLDCTAAPSSNLNGNMCKSCVGQSVANAAYAGQYFNPSTSVCVSSCPSNMTVDSNNVCKTNADAQQPIYSSGNLLVITLTLIILALSI